MDNLRTKIYRVYLKRLEIFQKWIPHENRRKKILINVCFEKLSRFSPTMCGPQSLRFLYLGILKKPVFSAALENEGALQQPTLVLAKPFATSRGPLKVCDIACSDMTMSKLIELEDIWNSIWELSLDKPYELNTTKL